MLFVNPGVTNNDGETLPDVSTEEFVRVMITNALSPMRVIEALQDLVLPSGTIGLLGDNPQAPYRPKIADGLNGLTGIARGRIRHASARCARRSRRNTSDVTD